MESMTITTTIAVLAAVAAVMFALYWFGLISFDVKRARMFIGSMYGAKARFSGCTGTIRRRFRMPVGDVTVKLDAALTNGTVTVEIAGAGGLQLLRLDADHPAGSLMAPAGEWLTQTIRLDDASGQYEITKA